jgi:uncharacterized membrane protein
MTGISPDARADGLLDALPGHVEQVLQATQKLHTDHHKRATRLERIVEGLVNRLARPAIFLAVVLLMACWIGLNLVMPVFTTAFDPQPFAILSLAASVAALGITLLILTTQRRDTLFNQHRAQLTSQMALLSEQKLAKIIALIEESRIDNPLLHNRVDERAETMATPIDAAAIGDAIRIIEDSEASPA